MKAMEANNMAAMREALEDVLEKIDRWRTDGVMEHWQYSQLFDIANAALSAPPRQCDVGTTEEQTKRMRNNCNKYKPSCKGCKHVTDLQKENCWLAWAQMPYEAQEGAGK